MLSATDLFCGAGGSSSGMETVAGVRVVRASNHWAKAIEVHNANMPHVDHDTWDISKAEPSRYPRTDILWASPSCTFWSPARGERQDFTEEATRPALFDLSDLADADDEPEPDEAKERSRALMQDVPRFAESHRYRAVIVENTVPLLKWWYFPKWIARMRAIGYRHKVLTLNSAFAHQLGRPAPQLRDRVYVVFWQERYREPDWDRWLRPSAWCPSCGEMVTALQVPKDHRKPYGAFGAQYVFRCPRSACRHGMVWPYTLPAAAAIDWMLPGQRIGDRAAPLSPKTMARIEAGLRRYAQGIVLEATGHTFERRPGVRAWSVEDPLRTLHASASKAVACPPLLMRHFTPRGRLGQMSTSVCAPGPAQTASFTPALLVPTEGRDGKDAMGAQRPLRTQTGRNELGLLTPAGGTWNDDA